MDNRRCRNRDGDQTMTWVVKSDNGKKRTVESREKAETVCNDMEKLGMSCEILSNGQTETENQTDSKRDPSNYVPDEELARPEYVESDEPEETTENTDQSILYAGEIDIEQFDDAELDVFSYLKTNGYPINGILEAYSVVSVKTYEKNMGHIIMNIQTLSKPIDEADAVDDQMNKWICDCKDYQFNRSVDLEEKTLADWGKCKHIRSVRK